MEWDREDLEWDDKTIWIDRSLSEDQSATIWRYTSLPKFINLITEGSLFCLLSSKFEDPKEGHLSDPTREQLRENYEDLSGGTELFEMNIELIEELRKVTYLNCWRIDEYEDYGMWHAYTNSSSGIAIKTTIANLIDSIEEGGGFEGRLAIKSVDYIDYRTEEQNSVGEGVFFPFRFKRVQHQNEKEFRIMVTDYPHRRMRIHDSFNAPKNQPILREVSIDPATLIEEIRLHPESGSALTQAVENVVQNLGDNIDIENVMESSLDDINSED